MKFGGTSVADINCIRNVAKKVQEQYLKNKKIVVVVSAMAGNTDNLVNLTENISRSRDLKEYEHALTCFKKILEENENDLKALTSKGSIFAEMKKVEFLILTLQKIKISLLKRVD